MQYCRGVPTTGSCNSCRYYRDLGSTKIDHYSLACWKSRISTGSTSRNGYSKVWLKPSVLNSLETKDASLD